ncbi:nitroreductase family protein [Oceanobacillus halophilus]|uniref:Nitroreductase n=1 Tax=Oceanobacillus halophilus TaxID=930130 RepID=A0A495A499_9BACI|nr:nitroreductase family protein [Oceanobacillus halophilus]RKQ33890.1 nitroreductase [Oceanobacillus halophilus]
MDVMEAIKKRREITRYADMNIPSDTLDKIADAGYFAPSGNNLPSKQLIVVQERQTLDKLAETTPYMKWLKEAPAAVAVTGNPSVSKYWLQDASIACGYIWLEAVELGLGSAFGAVYHSEDPEESVKRESHVRDLLDIPKENHIVAVIGLGYPKEQPKPKKHIPREKVISYERMSNFKE